jgi:phosphoribosyl-AMP cyclohydrolase
MIELDFNKMGGLIPAVVQEYDTGEVLMLGFMIQQVKEIRIDCDNDSVLLKVEQTGGAACHTGHKSCFFKRVEGGSVKIIGTPVFDPKEVYRT